MNSENNIVYNTDTGLFRGPDGAEYVECRFETACPVKIRVDKDVWKVRHNGKLHRLAWSEYRLPPAVIDALKEAVLIKLAKVAPSYLMKVKSLLHHLDENRSQLNPCRKAGFAGLDARKALELLESLPTGPASTFRELYSVLAIRKRAGCALRTYKMLREVRLNRSNTTLPDVRRWNPERGALTTAEVEHFRAHLVVRCDNETDHDHFIRVYLRTAVAVGKRAVQLLHAQRDALRVFPNDPRFQRFICIPGTKAQRNELPGFWPISDDLYDDLAAFAARPAIAEAQKRFGYFFVTSITSQSRVDGPRHSGDIQVLIASWINRNAVVSPRTGKVLKVTTTRLRHTVATQMAKKGYTKEDIQAMLEHKSDSAVLAYLDAVGNDMTPALEMVNEALGGVFSNLQNAFFKGKVIDRPEGKVEKPIVRPDPKNIAVVGQCGSSTACPKHPFFSCYNGCPFFLKFRDADEDANRVFIEKEYQRWRSAEPSATHSKAIDDFARIEQAMQEAEEQGRLTDERS